MHPLKWNDIFVKGYKHAWPRCRLTSWALNLTTAVVLCNIEQALKGHFKGLLKENSMNAQRDLSVYVLKPVKHSLARQTPENQKTTQVIQIQLHTTPDPLLIRLIFEISKISMAQVVDFDGNGSDS